MHRLLRIFLLITLGGISLPTQGADTIQGYYRHPTIHAETIVFVAEGDLWAVHVNGGAARRLTSHPGSESHPTISHDGKTIAFAAQYEGPTEVYTMPVSGGLPHRQTVEAERSIPAAWTPGGKLTYTTQHYSTLPANQLVTIDLSTNTRQRVPLSQASDVSYGRDGTLFFVRPRFHRQEVKRYKGGTARKIWRFSDGDREATVLTADISGESHSPNWYRDRVYFVTDLDGTMNIWSMDEHGSALRQHTEHDGWDVKSANLHQGRIVYRVGADIWLLDIETGVHRQVPISLTSDFDQLREKWVTAPMQDLSSAHLHPEGDSIALVSRGRLFVAPAKAGRLVQVSHEPGVRFRDACFLSNENLLTLSDKSGEFDFVKLPARGVDAPQPLTNGGTVLKWRGYPSPSGEHFAYSDKNYELWLVHVDSGKQIQIASTRESSAEGFGQVAWSPDSKWLVFSQVDDNTYAQLQLYNIETRTLTSLTSNRVNSVSPAWGAKGEWLYFLSDRGLSSVVTSPWGARQPEPFFDKPMKVYRMAMRTGIRSPFQETDELVGKEDSSDKQEKQQESKKDDAEAKKEPIEVKVDLEEIQNRVKPLPIPPGDYAQLSANSDALFWLETHRSSDGKTTSNLMTLKIGNTEKTSQQVTDDVSRYELSGDGNKLLLRKDMTLFIVDAKPTKNIDLSKSRVDLNAWQYSINVREDWRQLFVDAWRLHRDYFYDPNMHGLNWESIRNKYEPLVDRITTRDELSDLIGQMVSELSTLHTAVRGGDVRQSPDQVTLATLGARLERDEHAGGYRIDYIYQSDPDYPSELSPLADPDIDIQVGDTILAMNGQPVLDQVDAHLLLRQQQDKQVLLTVQRDEDKPRQVIVKPISDEAALRYRDWEYTRRLRVEKQGEGKIGYVHLKAMTGSNLTEWYRNFYPVFNRQGLIVDVRHNRGGNIDSIILEKLMRKAWFYWQGRVGKPTWNMQYAFRGHMVVLCDEHTASDGEAFAEGFRRLGLGKVIGTRTWGGEIWLTASNRLSDGGIATAAELGVYGPERTWLIEGHGVDPDIVVDNLPHATFKGEDAQLDAAIKYLQERIAANPRPVPPPPDYPDKSKE